MEIKPRIKGGTYVKYRLIHPKGGYTTHIGIVRGLSHDEVIRIYIIERVGYVDEPLDTNHYTHFCLPESEIIEVLYNANEKG